MFQLLLWAYYRLQYLESHLFQFSVDIPYHVRSWHNSGLSCFLPIIYSQLRAESWESEELPLCSGGICEPEQSSEEDSDLFYAKDTFKWLVKWIYFLLDQ